MKIILIDDEPPAIERLRRLLRTQEDVEIVAECSNGEEAVAAIEKHEPDVILLDIQMPGMDGFDVIEALDPERLPAVIFVTAYDQHAVRAFEAKALDYLLKPTTRERLAASIERVRERLGAAETGPLREFLDERAASRPKRITIRNGEKITFLPTGQIDWIESAGNYVVLHCGEENHILRETMSALERQLAPDSFYRLSRSAIVNLRRIKEVEAVSVSEYSVVLANGQRIPMTRSVRELERKLKFV
jgi:two-component system LytT family response regulator